MKTSRILMGVLVLSALPALAQPELKPINGLPYPLVSPEEAVRLVQPEKPIAIHLHDVTLQDALQELEKQSGITLDTAWGPNADKFLARKLSVDIETRSFNEAFRAVMEEADAKARLRRFRAGNILNVMFDEEVVAEDTPVSGKVPFEVRIQNIALSSSRSVTPGKTARRNQSSNFYVTLSTESDPRIPLVGGGRPRITRAEDERGQSLLLDERQPPFNLDFDPGRSSQTNIRLRTPETGRQKLAHLDGVIVYVLPTKYEKWEMNDVLVAKDASHNFQSGGQTIQAVIHSARQTGNGVQLDIEVNTGLPNGIMNDARSVQMSVNQLLSSIHLKDGAGRELTSSGYSSGSDNGKLSAQANFVLAPQIGRPFIMEGDKLVRRPVDVPKLAGPIALNLNVPVEFVQTEVPFSFSDLPLP
ncbi:hypothetical protein IAD21_05017 [Abditibacteriota bacterium]|nr:hypothetical protein IAD21_05017 [Abditibacteriota bacterium]